MPISLKKLDFSEMTETILSASRKPQAASRKPQAASRKPQAASRKPQAACPDRLIAQALPAFGFSLFPTSARIGARHAVPLSPFTSRFSGFPFAKGNGMRSPSQR
jgi:hypothetical protein